MIIFVILFTIGTATVTFTDQPQKETSNEIYQRKLRELK